MRKRSLPNWKSLIDRAVYIGMVYFAHPSLSVPGGLGLMFLSFPEEDYSASYVDLFAAVNHHVLGLFFIFISMASLVTVLWIGPKKCGYVFPCSECMTGREMRLFLVACLVQWTALSCLGFYFWEQGAKTGGSTYGLVSLAYCIRVGTVLAESLTKTRDANNKT